MRWLCDGCEVTWHAPVTNPNCWVCGGEGRTTLQPLAVRTSGWHAPLISTVRPDPPGGVTGSPPRW